MNIKKEDTHDTSFSWKVSSKFRKPLERQLTESVNIARASSQENLNSKSEFNSHSIERLLLPNEKEHFQCNECSALFVGKFLLMKHFQANHKRIICESCDFIS